jgi:hypothetical protein
LAAVTTAGCLLMRNRRSVRDSFGCPLRTQPGPAHNGAKGGEQGAVQLAGVCPRHRRLDVEPVGRGHDLTRDHLAQDRLYRCWFLGTYVGDHTETDLRHAAIVAPAVSAKAASVGEDGQRRCEPSTSGQCRPSGRLAARRTRKSLSRVASVPTVVARGQNIVASLADLGGRSASAR